MSIPDPSAFLICGGRAYQDRVVHKETNAIVDCERRDDGSRIVPLYTIEDAAQIIKSLREDTD